MSTPHIRKPRAHRVSALRAWHFTFALAVCGASVFGCREDPTSPGDPQRPPTTGGVGTTDTGGSSSGGGSTGVGGLISTGGSMGGGPATTGGADATIDLWYGDDQIFGMQGGPAPQRDVNVLGTVSGALLKDASYSVNGGEAVALPLGPDGERLIGPGQFNIELDRASLKKVPETNRLAITANVAGGDFLTKEFTLRVYEAKSVGFPFEVDWNALDDVAQVNQVAAIVDGTWALENDGVTVVDKGYDRLIALGDQTWAGNYDVLATFTLHGWNAWGSVGLAVGWQGHEGNASPRVDWPLEGLTWVRNVVPEPEMQIMTFERGVQERRPFSLALDTPYYLRAHTTRTGPNARVSMRIWRTDQKEPDAWQLSSVTKAHDGSVLLIAHHSHVTWGPVRVEAVP